ncbi:vWA domain-containing protein [Anaerotalea alkaliphila]|uniref:VWA domain-containing protein n=1 Tax=Anaerotalea alkaliphila TaxID=2662126 RepID=A0A7X5KM56_9FIRM|nr:vWA domain-containing protein [Anaerotalea alkaliphila]NDL67444.1 VWA domain-containing protein [Anaerotalea alkaliphila]
MKTNITELVFILDKSGSMAGLESDTIGGFNAMLKKQQGEPGEAYVTTVLFDDKYQVLHDRIDIRGIRPITDEDYFVEGSTALLDAIGKTILKAVNVQRHTEEKLRADKVLFVITTDGMENASREYTCEKISEMVKVQTEKYGWEFLFLGANIDAVASAGRFGIAAERSANYHADSKGTLLNYEVVGRAVSELRASMSLPDDWKAEIDQDFARRGKKGKG